MLLHYLKIAFRNMLKYKIQTLISVLGLAVGFTCFALATLWIRYEMTFDSFHKNAKQMYVVYRPDTNKEGGYSRSTPDALANYLKETFPEIEYATELNPSYSVGKVTVDGVEFPVLTINVDSSFFQMFDVKILAGSIDFRYPVSKMSERSNYPFDLMMPKSADILTNWRCYYGENAAQTIIKVFPGTNIKAFEKKLYEHEINKEENKYSKLTMIPVKKVRYTDTDIAREVKFRHIVVFSISGLLVIMCSLFNYLTCF